MLSNLVIVAVQRARGTSDGCSPTFIGSASQHGLANDWFQSFWLISTFENDLAIWGRRLCLVLLETCHVNAVSITQIYTVEYRIEAISCKTIIQLYTCPLTELL